ncbi:hypothetical protein PTTG_25825 [Puccinia triticina 1-1 BBBD Race 1]|uniref:Uncharacterized protein n=1 Tax=Puccinia triticina (isolate 1-1 / race 1 (BBBD)) TaxID=630390 RepID=A0A180GZ86_PUCT1|nr:hypothetical protein PTTG_25825 [Puccinia triticina 1-1 BBBD Race 1]
MFSRFLVVALLCSITHVWGVGQIVPMNIARIENVDRFDRFPFMALAHHDSEQTVEVCFSMEKPDTNLRDVRIKHLSLQRVIDALRDDPDGGKAIEALPTRSTFMQVVDKTLETGTDQKMQQASIVHWRSHYKPLLSMHNIQTSKIANLINRVCTRQLDAPSIILLPVSDMVFIQYPVITSDPPAESFVRDEITTAQIISALDSLELTDAVQTAIDGINSVAAEHLHQSHRSSWPVKWKESLSKHWSHQNFGMELDQMHDKSGAAVRGVLEQILEICLHEMPVSIGKAVSRKHNFLRQYL